MTVFQIREQRNEIVRKVDALIKASENHAELKCEIEHALHTITWNCYEGLKKNKHAKDKIY